MTTKETTDSMESELSKLHEIANSPASRRKFLAGSGIAVLGLVAAACGKSDSGTAATTKPAASTTASTAAASTTAATTATTTATTAGGSGDLTVAAFAAGLEALAVGTYKAAGEAAAASKLGNIPPAVGEFVTVAMKQHQDYLDAWNKVLKANGKPEVTTPNAKLKPVVDEAFGKVTDVVGAAKLALMLEDIAAATYLDAIPALQNKDAITLASQGHIIDMQHAAVLHFVLGEYPVPDVFAKTDKAAKP